MPPSSKAPPFFDGATLGGTQRLRAFAQNRFWDRSADYASLELRLIPQWNPLGHIKLLKPADITWMEWVVFAEAGRVNNAYDLDLLKHLKGDFRLRAATAGQRYARPSGRRGMQ